MILINLETLLHELHHSNIVTRSRNVSECFFAIVNLIQKKEIVLNTCDRIGGAVAPCPNCGSVEMQIRIERDRWGFKGTFQCLECGKRFGVRSNSQPEVFKAWNYSWEKFHKEVKGRETE